MVISQRGMKYFAECPGIFISTDQMYKIHLVHADNVLLNVKICKHLMLVVHNAVYTYNGSCFLVVTTFANCTQGL